MLSETNKVKEIVKYKKDDKTDNKHQNPVEVDVFSIRKPAFDVHFVIPV